MSTIGVIVLIIFLVLTFRSLFVAVMFVAPPILLGAAGLMLGALQGGNEAIIQGAIIGGALGLAFSIYQACRIVSDL